MSRVEIQSGKPDEVFSAIRTEWQDLFAAADCTPFLSWEWMSTWFKNFGENKEPVLLKAYDKDELIGILPMFIERSRFLGMGFKSLSLLGTGPGGADYLGTISRHEQSERVADCFVEFIGQMQGIGLVRLQNIDPVSDLARSFVASKNNLANTPESVEAFCPQVDLAEGWDAVLTQSKRRSNFRRRLKKLEQMDGFEFRSVTEPAELEAAFERFLSLHNDRWKDNGGSELSGHPRLVAFQRALISALSNSGMLRFDELWVEGKCRSSVYAFDHRDTFYYYNSGYDGECADLSVGLVLIGLSIESAIARGVKVYDFLRGDETYKFDWANRSKTLVSVGLKSRELPVLAREWMDERTVAMKGIAKSALPTGIQRSLGNWSRSLRRSYSMSEK